MMVLASPVGRVVGREVRGEWVFLADRTWFLLHVCSEFPIPGLTHAPTLL